jgi:hypothetical protein
MSTLPNRRRFIVILPIAGAALLAACAPESTPTSASASPVAPVAPVTPTAPAAEVSTPPTPAPALASNLVSVDEKDAQAIALGYVTDAARANKDKYKAGSQCSNCALFLGQAGDTSGGCPLFSGKKVMAKGWCASWVKQA